MDSVPTLPNLTPDGRIWRLDWYGETAYRAGIRRYRQPCIKVSLSPLLCGPDDNRALLTPHSTQHNCVHSTWVPISSLPLIAIGDLWKSGQRISSPDYQQETFRSIKVDSESVAFIKAGLSLDDNFLLPLCHHPWHRPHTHSYCVVVTLASGIRLIVPCAELIRFYFGSSGNLLQRLFTTPLSDNPLWEKKRFTKENRHLHLVLADRISGASAADVGRIATCDYAWRSATSIYTSCQKASIRGVPAYPYTGFPFEGHTDLTVHGIWLPFGYTENSTFLAYRIKSCSHPFPFDGLSYEAADRKRHYTKNSGGAEHKKRFTYKNTNTKAKIENSDPGNARKQQKKRFIFPAKFPDLKRKHIWREKLEALPKTDIILIRTDGHMERVSYGEPANGTGTVSIDFTQEDSFEETALPKFVKAGLKIIASEYPGTPHSQTIRLIPPDDKPEPIFTLPIIVDEDGVIIHQAPFVELNGDTRQRRACFVATIGADGSTKNSILIESARRGCDPKIISTVCTSIVAIAELLRTGTSID